MSTIPTNVRNFSEVQFALRMIDERISELLSIHGKMLTRGGILTTGGTSSLEGDGTNPVQIDNLDMGTRFGSDNKGSGFTPNRGAIYRDLVPKAWALSTNVGVLENGFNLMCASGGTGIYNYTFLTPMTDANYAVIATVDENPGATTVWSCHVVGRTINGFSIYISATIEYDSTPGAEHCRTLMSQGQHAVVVFGQS